MCRESRNVENSICTQLRAHFPHCRGVGFQRSREEESEYVVIMVQVLLAVSRSKKALPTSPVNWSRSIKMEFKVFGG